MPGDTILLPNQLVPAALQAQPPPPPQTKQTIVEPEGPSIPTTRLITKPFASLRTRPIDSTYNHNLQPTAQNHLHSMNPPPRKPPRKNQRMSHLDDLTTPDTTSVSVSIKDDPSPAEEDHTNPKTSTTTSSSSNPLLNPSNPLVTDLEQEVLDEYARLLGNVNAVGFSFLPPLPPWPYLEAHSSSLCLCPRYTPTPHSPIQKGTKR
ncbi:uncharacterized protein BO72DRAFT_23747 [Aspergillus fijiensis CBS 313.89]|uniref:Uncharacterized protein n=1 Tax=Aspergillus fijiensis CBS 313.89 TaxID=1448319 RepID=A0A8G1RVC0_9EURO|nr:uncharacterized protein BO72DRAFT_23747 [Aspergillus fijiensis CBS 313.89]RAK79899.1 hypothetical protein BO72DRAFT_23747 [Aspergillus fijiensis CBS 313.89]